MKHLQNLIGGTWSTGDVVDFVEIINPATETPVASMPLSTALEVNAAVDAAADAAKGWSKLPLQERVDALLRIADVLEDHVAEIADIEELDMGRPAAVGEQWIRGAVQGFRNDVELALKYPFVQPSADHTSTVTRKPLGVAGVIVPWNFPTNVILAAIGPSLAAGNTVVLKPSERAPMSAMRLAELFDLPGGVLNVVFGVGKAGAALTQNPGVKVTHFTGSVASGTAVAAEGAKHLRRVVLELGGKDPAIVDSGVDVADVAADVARGAFTNTGQLCTSIERIYVHRAVAEEFTAELVAAAATYVRREEGERHDRQLGPMVDGAQRDIVVAHVDDAVSRGATVLAGGVVPDGPGYWYPATVLADVTDEMLIVTDETFGPVAAVQVVDDFAEGVAKAKKTEFGLSATVYSNSSERIDLAAREIETGIIWVNQWLRGTSELIYEPAGLSGVTALGGFAGYDAITRPSSLVGTVAGDTPESVPVDEVKAVAE
ncbi:aldehyde dehydrogenase family protein [Amycolatopsis panacis]|uniref:Aldehyde dehydrogenase n=1 Tax=Amycolatopsis panacis TaxID=2340917 RepID=A0A419I2B8_9PSEU|nr:aldehyde dehydrogenase family protein [Amycolatopsis panacis]RJQ84006.1 aldehyde dehydrogenase [Amycolatopsis panacis]